MAIFDTHAHYVKNDFGEALHPLLSSMSEAGVEKIMAVGYDLDSSREEMQLAEQFPSGSSSGYLQTGGRTT